ncbi:hypothetical protein CTAYLR_000198 [Chrysophaeum taylorii]|uniref:EF-hand domain-containing protein n=1 Tax=Chrysophaeum taylorii TaxID=2483200 RepID=A0AAD7UEG0_9STRA|nr:hypothetical protein CTAYLR_000198 [Chrysophaeum taylorii]
MSQRWRRRGRPEGDPAEADGGGPPSERMAASDQSAKFAAHEWDPKAIRRDPNTAFELFDANADGVISVAELCFVSRHTNPEMRRKGSLFDEMKLFHALDADGDSVISRNEFCKVVSDPKTFSDEALACIAKWCEIVEDAKNEAMLEAGDLAAEDDPPISERVSRKIEKEKLEALTATLGVVQGVQILKRNVTPKAQDPVPPPFPETRGAVATKSRGEYELVLELIGLGVTLVDGPWYDLLGVADPVSTTPYVVVYSDDGSEIARSDVDRNVKGNSSVSAASWPPVYVTAKKLRNMLTDLPAGLRLAIFAKQPDGVDDIHVGTTAQFPLVRFDDPDLEAGIGPLLAFDEADNLGAKILGTQKWVPAGVARLRRQKSLLDACSCVQLPERCYG